MEGGVTNPAFSVSALKSDFDRHRKPPLLLWVNREVCVYKFVYKFFYFFSDAI